MRARSRSCGCPKMAGRDGGTTCEMATFRAYKQREIKRLSRQIVHSDEDAARIIREVIGTDLSEREHMVLIGLDRNQHVVGIADGASTERSMCLFRPTDAVGTVIASSLSATFPIAAVIMGHNHPGGSSVPSDEDLATTEEFCCRVGRLLTVLDHVIVTPDPDLSRSLVQERPRIFAVQPCKGGGQ